MERRLINTQRKLLHDILVDAGVDPATGRWTNDKKGWTSATCETLEIGLCYFLFNPDSDGFTNIKMRPAPDGSAEIGEVGLTWTSVLGNFKDWARCVKQEIVIEDPWARYAAFVPPIEYSERTDNSPFTFTEAQSAEQALTALLGYIKSELPEHGIKIDSFRPHFENLADSAKKGAGRIDWSNQFVGLVISICVALSLAPEEASNIWRYWIRLVTSLLPAH